VAYTVGFWVTAIAIPSALFVFIAGQLADLTVSLLPFLSGVAVVALGQLFYLALTLMLGTFFSSRGPVAGIGIAVALGGMLLKGLVPRPVLMVTPWPFDDLSGALAGGLPLPANWYVPLLATGGWIVVLLAVALWRFNREEF
jgi:hypothetical protein